VSTWRPSRADIDMTEGVAKSAVALGLVLYGHVIVARSGHTSFKSSRLLQDLGFGRWRQPALDPAFARPRW
jgi:hypothetical protein